ncbi:MAG: TraR/DksA family transcriptional regulator [Steroidobacteraceae bacterium]|jgi:DnaK suppressor protein
MTESLGMNAGKSHLDAGFMDKQRGYLIRLRDALRSAARSDQADEVSIKADSAAGPREFEDDAQKLAALELDGNLVVRDFERLERVNRALEKIADGTYGLSDVSGQRIPQERLEAVPEAICTLAEEKSNEKRRRT